MHLTQCKPAVVDRYLAHFGYEVLPGATVRQKAIALSDHMWAEAERMATCFRCVNEFDAALLECPFCGEAGAE